MGKGLSSFQKRFRELPEKVRAGVVPDMIAAADDMAGEMRALAPKISGRLAASIAVTGEGEQTPAHSQPGGSMVVPSGAVAITAGNTRVRYAHLVEHGTKHTAPNPFFFMGYVIKKQDAAAAIKRGIRRVVRGAK